MNKKSLIWTLASLMVLASMILAACGGGATQAPAATQPPAATEPPAMTEAPTEAMTEAPTEAMTEAPAANVSFAYPAGGELEKALTGAYKGTTVTVDGAFEGNDPDGVKFDESVKAFEEATGIDVNYIGNKEFEATISARVDAGDPPDIVDFPQPGKAGQFVRGAILFRSANTSLMNGLPSNTTRAGVIWSHSMALKWAFSTASMARAWSGIPRRRGMLLVMRSPKPGKS